MSDWEIDEDESGVEWELPQHVLVRTKYGEVLAYKGFVYDRDSAVVNWAETDPTVFPYVAAATHDWAYVHRQFADGLPMSRKTADKIYYELCRYSTNFMRRKVARLRYVGVRLLGGIYWNRRQKPIEIPVIFRHLYGSSEEAYILRYKLPIIVVGVKGRLVELPPRIP